MPRKEQLRAMLAPHGQGEAVDLSEPLVSAIIVQRLKTNVCLPNQFELASVA